MNGILSVQSIDERLVLYFLGIKVSSRRLLGVARRIKYAKQKCAEWMYKRKQDFYDLAPLQQSENLVVFLLPAEKFMSGGIRSIYDLCAYTRKVYPDSMTLLATFPSNRTYLRNRWVEREEQIYRWAQIPAHARNVKKLIVHIPEYLAGDFYGALSQSDVAYLKSIHDLQINIMNQNMDLMPPREAFASLYRLTHQVTQTLAFVRNCTQECADTFQMPTHLFSTCPDYSIYKQVLAEAEGKVKTKTIVLSPDRNEKRDLVIEAIKEQLPDYGMVVVNKLTFREWLQLVARSFCVITFGEGFDGYFNQPARLDTLSFSVYNDTFFPGPHWAELPNVYASYEEMAQKLSQDIRKLENDREAYLTMARRVREMLSEIYGEELYVDNLTRFYQRRYDYVPQSSHVNQA